MAKDLINAASLSTDAAAPLDEVKNVLAATVDYITGTVREVTLTNAQILALNATPVAVIPAPGAGYAIVVRDVIAMKPAGAAFAAIHTDDNLALKYTDASGAVVTTIETTGFLDSTSAKVFYSPGAGVLPVANAAIVAHMLNSEITTGDTTLTFRINYLIVPVA